MRSIYIVGATLLAVVLFGAVAATGFMYSGVYDVSASTPDNPYVAWAVHVTSDASVGVRLGGNIVPAGLNNAAAIGDGAKLFIQNCEVCHGAPGVAPTHIAMGLNPPPPDLFRATRKPDEQENFQFIHNGVKMTAMPAFGASEGGAHIWNLVAFLNKLPGISATEYAKLTKGSGPAAN